MLFLLTFSPAFSAPFLGFVKAGPVYNPASNYSVNAVTIDKIACFHCRNMVVNVKPITQPIALMIAIGFGRWDMRGTLDKIAAELGVSV